MLIWTAAGWGLALVEAEDVQRTHKFSCLDPSFATVHGAERLRVRFSEWRATVSRLQGFDPVRHERISLRPLGGALSVSVPTMF